MVRIGFCLLLQLSLLSIEAQIDTASESFTAVSDAPVFSIEKDPIKLFIQKSIVYPGNALCDKIEGRVIVSMYIDTCGNTKDHTIKRGVRSDLDREALRVAKLLKFDKPAMQLGKPIEIYYLVPVEFILPKRNDGHIDVL